MSSTTPALGQSWEQDNQVVGAMTPDEKKALVKRYIEGNGDLDGYCMPPFAAEEALKSLGEEGAYFEEAYRSLLSVRPDASPDYEAARRAQLDRQELPPWHPVAACLHQIRNQDFLRKVVASLPPASESFHEHMALYNVTDDRYLADVARTHHDRSMRTTAIEVGVTDEQLLLELAAIPDAECADTFHHPDHFHNLQVRLAARNRLAVLRGMRQAGEPYLSWISTGDVSLLPEGADSPILRAAQ